MRPPDRVVRSQSEPEELLEGIRGDAIAPGWIVTDMAAVNLRGDGYDRRRMASRLERVADSSEVAAAVYLASPGESSQRGPCSTQRGSYLRM